MQQNNSQLVRNSIRGSPVEVTQELSGRRMFIDSREFEELGELRRGGVDVENINQSYHQHRQRQLQSYAKNINITDEGLRRKFFSTAQNYQVVRIKEPQLVLYNHPKKGLRVITVDELMMKPGYRPANIEEDIKFDTMDVINELNERITQREMQDANPQMPPVI